MKQKILFVDEKIRQIIEQDNDERFLKKSANFSYGIVFALVSTLIVFWSLPLYFHYVFSRDAFSIWIWVAVTWVIGSAIVIVIKPLIERKVSITRVLRMISLTFVVNLRASSNRDSAYNTLDYTQKQDKSYFENAKRILVPIDGSLQSLKALNGAVGLFNDAAKTRIFALNVIEWTNDEEKSLDGEMTSKIEEEGRRMLRSVVISPNKETFERVVKIGDPSSKIVELAEKLDIELNMMGSTGIGNTDQDLGHVTRRVLKITSKPVVLFK